MTKPRKHPAKEARKAAAIAASESEEMKKAFRHMFDGKTEKTNGERRDQAKNKHRGR